MNEHTPQPVLFPAWAVGDYDYTDIVCETHAREFANERGLVWGGPTYTEESAAGYAYEIWPGDGESDYPHSCGVFTCGVLLDTRLTDDGEQYVRDNYPPTWWHLWGVTA